MDLVLKISAIASLLLMLVGIGTIIFKIGNHNATVAAQLKKMDETLSELKIHMDDPDIHINTRLQEHVQEEQKTWHKNVDDKLNLLLSKKI